MPRATFLHLSSSHIISLPSSIIHQYVTHPSHCHPNFQIFRQVSRVIHFADSTYIRIVGNKMRIEARLSSFGRFEHIREVIC